MEGTPGSSSGTNFTFQSHTFQDTNADAEQARRKKQQPRQLLSCTVCRERKVKCDRTKPCSACCARGKPRECHFVVADGADYGPIEQSYELRKLRAENIRLKERLRASRLPLSDDDYDLSMSSPDAAGSTGASSRVPAKPTSLKQKRFRMHNPPDSIYFGSPGMSTVINEFSDLNVGSQSLSHTMPHGPDMYVSHEGQPYPFATMWPAYPQACIPALLECLPARDHLFAYLDAFQRRAQSCSMPHTPDEVTRREIERFFSDAKKNAETFPDMLALIFAVLAQGVQHGIFDRSGGAWVEGVVESESSKGDVYIAAAMQALRMASFMNRPTLLGLQTLIMIGPYLTNSGRFLDAWTLFGTTVRLAQAMGLHRNPKFFNPAPDLRECSIRQSLWWWMLHMDQQYSMTLGSPLGISGIGDCLPPETLTTNTTVLRLGGIINHFTVLARQILSSDRLSNVKIDKFTDELRALWDTLPESLQFDETWLNPGKQIPEWPLDAMAASFFGKVHSYLILLNRQRLSESVSSTPHSTPTTTPTTPHPSVYGSNFSPINITATSTASTPSFTSLPADTAKPPRGRPLVISSSLSLLSAFLYTYHRVPAALICWTMGQQAFNAAMLLLLDALETGGVQHVWRVEQAYAVFLELERRGVHKLAGPAVARVSWGLETLRRREQEREGTTAAARMHHPVEPAAAASAAPAMAPDKGKEPQRSPAEPLHDAVMGNTGMFLLEDPGLQSFAPESFAPLGWDVVGADLSAVKTVPVARQPPFQPDQQTMMPPGLPIHPAPPPTPGLAFHHYHHQPHPQPQPQPQHPHVVPFGRGEAAHGSGVLPGAVNVGGPHVEWAARGGNPFGHGHAAGGGGGSGSGHGRARGRGRPRGRGH